MAPLLKTVFSELTRTSCIPTSITPAPLLNFYPLNTVFSESLPYLVFSTLFSYIPHPYSTWHPRMHNPALVIETRSWLKKIRRVAVQSPFHSCHLRVAWVPTCHHAKLPFIRSISNQNSLLNQPPCFRLPRLCHRQKLTGGTVPYETRHSSTRVLELGNHCPRQNGSHPHLSQRCCSTAGPR